METGLIHLYCGDGKGKTTAAMGLALRCAGAAGKVLIYQFLKDGSSSEMTVLRDIRGIDIITPVSDIKFVSRMTPGEKEELSQYYIQKLDELFTKAAQGYDMLILDEVTYLINYNFVEEEYLINLIKSRSEGLELVMTGRDPADALVDLADYVSEIKKLKHPFDKGVLARTMIEK